ncbi:MAG: flagellar hook protein, partial [Firmicutes bacterium]|nr:flagellar hook protein [Bacillota bacterium]
SLLTDPVTFTTTADADKIVAAVKSMVEDYNTMLTELREAFNTVPAQKSDGSKYEPLTESDQESMSDTAIANYEEKAKQGILFADQDLSSMYNSLLKAISPGGTDGVTLRSMGISTGYYQGLTTIEFDETKFRETLSTDPDSVRDAFTKVAGDGSSTNGIMTSMQNTLKAYASVEGTKGILINKAGSKYSASSLLQNSLKDEIDDYSDLITKWQDKMSDKIDYYTRQYTRLESLISEMNSQSSSLSGLTGS